MTTRRKKAVTPVSGGSLPLARVKLSFSRYVRDVQMRGHAITITQHGRPAAMLVPVTATSSSLTVHEAAEARPLGELRLRPARGAGAGAAALRQALAEERDE